MSLLIEPVARVPQAVTVAAEVFERVWSAGAPSNASATTGTVIASGGQEQARWGGSGTTGAYLDAVTTQLRSYLRMDPGWDTLRARPVSPAAAQVALALLRAMRVRTGGSIVPTVGGGIQLEWHDGRVDVEIEVLPSGDASLFAVDEASGETVERWVVPGHPAVDAWLERLAQRN